MFGMIRPIALMSSEIFVSGVLRVHQVCRVVTVTTACNSYKNKSLDSHEDIHPIQNCRTCRPMRQLSDILELCDVKQRKVGILLKDTSVSNETLINIAVMLRESGQKGTNFQTNLFKIPFLELERRLAYMKEAGVSVEYEYLTQFKKLFRKSVLVLRAGKVLPDVKSYSEELLSQVNCDRPMVEELDDYASYEEVHLKTVLHYIEWFLDVRLQKYHSERILPSVPLHYVAENLVFLTQIVKLQREKIITNLRVLNASPSNVKAVMEIGRHRSDLNMPRLLHSYVNLMLEDAVSLQTKLDLLEERGISKNEIMEVPQVLKKSEDFVEKILPSLKSIPELKYSNLLKVLRYQFPQHRVAYMVASKSFKAGVPFSVQNWNERSVKLKMPKDIAQKFDMSVSAVKAQLSYFPQWFHTDVETIFDTQDYLLELGYSKEEIGKNIILFLYKRSTVEDALQKYVYTDPDIKANIALSNNRHLALCLYHIQKKHNFARVVIDEPLE